MERIRRGRPGEGKTLRDFAQKCFAQESGEPDFARLLPKVYARPEETAEGHLLLEADGKMIGMLYAPVTELVVGSDTLLVGHIGSVCVSPEYRGNGVMRRLMLRAIEEFLEMHCDLAALCGQRQRYEQYGFFPMGYKTEFVIGNENVRGPGREGCLLRSVWDGAGESSATARICEGFHRQNGIYMKRGGMDFFAVLASWEAEVLTLWDQGECCGYLSVFEQEGYHVISELRLKSPEYVQPLLGCLKAAGVFPAKLCLLPGAPEYEATLGLCERYIVGPDHNIRIFNIINTVSAYLRCQMQHSLLPHGKVTLPIQGGGSLCLCAEAGGADVYLDEGNGEARADDPGLTWSEAAEVLFSPLSARRSVLARNNSLIAAWLPLPLCLEQNDCF